MVARSLEVEGWVREEGLVMGMGFPWGSEMFWNVIVVMDVKLL